MNSIKQYDLDCVSRFLHDIRLKTTVNDDILDDSDFISEFLHKLISSLGCFTEPDSIRNVLFLINSFADEFGLYPNFDKANVDLPPSVITINSCNYSLLDTLLKCVKNETFPEIKTLCTVLFRKLPWNSDAIVKAHSLAPDLYRESMSLLSDTCPSACLTSTALQQILLSPPFSDAKWAYDSDLHQPYTSLSIRETLFRERLLLMKLVAELDSHAAEMRRSIINAALTRPAYSVIYCIHQLLMFSPNLVKDDVTAIDCVIETCLDIERCIRPILVDESPEGQLPDWLIEAELSRDGGERLAAPDSHLLPEYVTMCAWRCVRHTSDLFGWLLVSHRYEVVGQLDRLVAYFLSVVLETRHRGAFQASLDGFYSLVRCLVELQDDRPRVWIEAILTELEQMASLGGADSLHTVDGGFSTLCDGQLVKPLNDDGGFSTLCDGQLVNPLNDDEGRSPLCDGQLVKPSYLRFCETRRGAGTPFFCEVVFAALRDSNLTRSSAERLLQVVQGCTDRSNVTAAHRAALLQSLYILNALYTSSRLANDVRVTCGRVFLVAIRAASSDHWPQLQPPNTTVPDIQPFQIRNMANQLFEAARVRCFGRGRSTTTTANTPATTNTTVAPTTSIATVNTTTTTTTNTATTIALRPPAVHFFRRAPPALAETLWCRLRGAVTARSECIDPSLFAVLLLIRQLKFSSPDRSSTFPGTAPGYSSSLKTFDDAISLSSALKNEPNGELLEEHLASIDVTATRTNPKHNISPEQVVPMIDNNDAQLIIDIDELTPLLIGYAASPLIFLRQSAAVTLATVVTRPRHVMEVLLRLLEMDDLDANSKHGLILQVSALLSLHRRELNEFTDRIAQIHKMPHSNEFLTRTALADLANAIHPAPDSSSLSKVRTPHYTPLDYPKRLQGRLTKEVASRMVGDIRRLFGWDGEHWLLLEPELNDCDS